MLRYHCLDCGRLTDHLSIPEAAARAGVTRATIYNWLNRNLLHYVLRPSGRKFICSSSLVRPGARQSQPLRMVSGLD